MEDTSMIQIATLGLTTLLLPLSAMLWKTRADLGERVARLETTITNGLSDDVRHIRENCPGCTSSNIDHERRLSRLESDNDS